LTAEILQKYFCKMEDRYHVIPQLKQGVVFKNINLMERKAMRLQSSMDFVFCRNVLIYFSNEAKKQVINSLYDTLKAGGFIFLGPAESVGRISAAFKLVKLEKSLSYQK